MTDNLQRARDTIASIPLLSASGATPERLGGLTNLVYRVGDYCLRMPGLGTEEYINRADEKIATHAAVQAGVSPDVLYVDTATGIMVTRFIGDGVTLTPALFSTREGAVTRAGRALAKLHGSGVMFPAKFDLFAMIDGYLSVLSSKGVTLPKGYHDVMAEAVQVRAELAKHPAQAVACHCDPLCENFVDTGSRVWIIDWEYAGMNDPMWDLGDLSVEGGFTDQQDEALLNAYFGGEPDAAHRGRMVMYKAMSDLFWTLWGLIQLANNNPAEDFRTYADDRFERCRTLMKTPEFIRHLNAVRG
ncbi:MAG: phosphotransferase [Paracoccaceae bacterium]